MGSEHECSRINKKLGYRDALYKQNGVAGLLQPPPSPYMCVAIPNSVTFFARTHDKTKVYARLQACFNQHNAVEFEYHFAWTRKDVHLCFIMSPGKMIFAVLEL